MKSARIGESINETARNRVHEQYLTAPYAFMQRNGIAAVFRLIPEKPQTVEELGLPEQLHDLIDVSEGLVVTIRRAKTDQEGRGAEIGIPFGSSERTCPVLALRAWLNAASIEAGAVFRGVNRHGGLGAARLSDRDVARVVKACVEAAGYDPTTFAGHSLRSGFITTAARAGVPACRRAGVPACRKPTSRTRVGTSPSPCCGATSGGAACSWTMRRRGWGCDYSAAKGPGLLLLWPSFEPFSGLWESRRRSVRSLDSM